MDKKQGLTFAGEYVLDEFAILKADSDLALDIRHQLNGFYLYEDMFGAFTSGTAVIRDTLDLINVFGRGGKNLIRIKVTTPSLGQIEGYFHLYRISDRSVVAERTQVYTLNFVSSESLTDTNLNISRRFVGSPSDVADMIYKRHLNTRKTVTVTPSSNRVAYVSNFWTGIENLAFLSDNAISDKGAADFVHFENRDGYNFISLSSLVDKPTIQTFIKTNFIMVTRPSDNSNVRDLNLEFQQIQDIKVIHLYDFMTDSEIGGINTRTILHDITRKSYSIVDHNQTQDKRIKLNPNRIYTDQVITSIRPKLIPAKGQFGLFEPADLSNATFKARRAMHMSMVRAQKIEIDVMGRLDYTVGKRVRVNLTQLKNITKEMSEDEIRDTMLSGYYIITAILHKFDGKTHSCKIELTKDSTIAK